MKHNNLQFS